MAWTRIITQFRNPQLVRWHMAHKEAITPVASYRTLAHLCPRPPTVSTLRTLKVEIKDEIARVEAD